MSTSYGIRFLAFTIITTLISIFPLYRSLPQTPPAMTNPRGIRKIFEAIEQDEGLGARVRRSIGGYQLRELSPFLMLDHFSSTSPAGFPDHPHRGQGKLFRV